MYVAYTSAKIYFFLVFISPFIGFYLFKSLYQACEDVRCNNLPVTQTSLSVLQHVRWYMSYFYKQNVDTK